MWDSLARHHVEKCRKFRRKSAGKRKEKKSAVAHQDYDKEIEDLGEAFGEAGSLMLRVILSYLRGQSADYTALAVVQRMRTYNPQTGKHSVGLHLKHLERYPSRAPTPR
jgi:hypothetical protein